MRLHQLMSIEINNFSDIITIFKLLIMILKLHAILVSL